MSKLLQDNDGNTSSMRIVWVISVLTIIGVWAVVSLKNNQMQSFSVGDAVFIGMLFSGKVGQKYIESRNGKKK